MTDPVRSTTRPGATNGNGNGASAGALRSRPRRHLPSPVSSFIGREAERDELVTALAGARLLTLCGPPGVGKTRLALEVARKAAPGFRDGAAWIDLAPLSSRDVVLAAVAAALLLQELPGRPLDDLVLRHLEHRNVLLVVDNCEHVIGAAAEVVETILEGCEEVTVLATSRESLTISGERRWFVPPLTDAESVELFRARAAETQPAFAPSAEAGNAIAETCRRLDGIPLAIELAAARAGVLTPNEIAARLDDRFSLLAGASRTADSRHQTLAGALDWSHELLSGDERVLFRRLSVFSGGFTLHGAQAVCAGDELDRDRVFELLAALVAKSLVSARTTGPHARYSLLESIRAYAAARLDQAGEGEDMAARHAVWCIGLAEAAEPELGGAHQQLVLARLEADYDNIRAAFAWALDRSDGDDALRLAAALSLFWRVRGGLAEGRRWLGTALAKSPGAPAPLRAKGLWGAALMDHMLGDNAVAISLVEESLEIYRQLGDAAGQSRALLVLANASRATQEPEQALQMFKQSTSLAREAGDSWSLDHSLALAGSAHYARGELAAARRNLDEAASLARQAGDKQGLRMALLVLGELALSQGDYDHGEAVLHEAIAICRELGEIFSVAVAYCTLGQIACCRADYPRSRRLQQASLRLHRELGTRVGEAFALLCLGSVSLKEGDLPAAKSLFEEAIALGPSARPASTQLASRGLGEVALAAGDLDEAKRWFESAIEIAGDAAHRRETAMNLSHLAEVAARQGDQEGAATLHHQVMHLCLETGAMRGVAESLESLASLAGEGGRPQVAVRLLSAADALLARSGEAWSQKSKATHHALKAALRSRLSPKEFNEAWKQGSTMSARAAIAYAERGRGGRKRATKGWESLTRAERDVVRLVAEGLSNPEIAERLFISRGTVHSHLRHVFAKLEVNSRTVLAMQASQQGEAAEG